MKPVRSGNQIRLGGAFIALALLASGLSARSGDTNTPYPSDLAERCPAGTKKLSFDEWFRGGKVTAGGLVFAAKGTDVSSGATLDLYRWAYQMFLHVTSPAKGRGSAPIFASPEYYALSTADAKGNRRFVEQTEQAVQEMEVRANKRATDDYSIVHDSAGKAYIIVPPKQGPKGKQLVLNRLGREVPVANVATDSTGKVVFNNAAGRPILGAKPVADPEANDVIAPQPTARLQTSPVGQPRSNKPSTAPPPPIPVIKVIANGLPNYVDLNGNPVPNITSTAGEADASIQFTRPYPMKNGKSLRSMIYYSIAVNDAYAYLRTMVSHGVKPPDDNGYYGDITPTDSHEIGAVNDYAKKHGKSITNPNALIVELKTAWVDAAAVDHPERYVTVEAKVPKFDTSDPKRWVQNGTQIMKVALVGMHVVGSTNGHYNLVWATFEHIYNTPSYAYTYVDLHGTKRSVAASSGGTSDYLFGHPSASATRFSPAARIQTAAPNIVIESTGGRDITGVPVSRLSAFGCPTDESPNNFDRSPELSNTSILSLNKDVYTRLPDADPRKYYFMVGATWVQDNVPPGLLWTQEGKGWKATNGIPYGPDILGTPFVANTTMETFDQAPSYKAGGVYEVLFTGGGVWEKNVWIKPWKMYGQYPAVGCFSCHQGYDIHDMSHVFRKIAPLW
ncbi:MAG TPA: hypothetical protein VKT78_03125 [Fimbriimonadaceae bacterium]|nr:hypothetical protein [Fimbriimonadaceae bacterium]